MHQGAALQSGEHAGVQLLVHILVIAEDHAAARAAQRLVGRRGHHMGIRQRARMKTGGHEPGEMGHIDHEIGADGIRDLAETRKIDDPRIGGRARDDQLRLMFFGEPRDFVIVDPAGILAHAILHGIEPLAGLGGRGTVGQMTARGQRQAEEGIARLQQRHEDRAIGLGAGMGLNIRKAAVEQTLGARNRNSLDDVDILAAAVIAPARIAFRIFVGEHRALRFEHSAADDVLGGDELEMILLALGLGKDGVGNLGIARRKTITKETGTGARRPIRIQHRHSIVPFAIGGPLFSGTLEGKT